MKESLTFDRLILLPMNAQLYQKIANTTLARQSRDNSAQYVLSHPEQFADLLELSFEPTDKNHIVACHVLQLILEQKPNWILPHLDFFFKKIPTITDESILRPTAKICMELSELNEKTPVLLTEEQLQFLFELGFDKIINPKTKVASKVHFIRMLYHLGKQHLWIHDELKPLLIKDYEQHSPAYKAVAREILKKLK